MIQLRHITKIFKQKGREVKAVSDISLTVPKGKIFGIIGTSGAGKSTLIRCVNLLETPTQGEVIIDGQDLTKLSKAQLANARKNIGMIFQHFNLLSSRTVHQNIAFPLELDQLTKAEINSRVEELAKLVGLSDKLHEYPASLSGGQKQRVAIARTLANNPKVLLCDEATSALDPTTTHSILDLLKTLNQKLDITILLITHEMDVVKAICDEVAVIDHGVLVEQGELATVFAHPQMEVTKRFLSATNRIAIPNQLKAQLSTRNEAGKDQLLKLSFSKDATDDAVISKAARLYHIDSSIVAAQLDDMGAYKFGSLLLRVSGDEENRNQAVKYYEAQGIVTEVLGYV